MPKRCSCCSHEDKDYNDDGEDSNLQPPPKLSSFFLQVLLSLHILQNSSQCDEEGIHVTDVAKFMKKYYCLSGDIVSQVHTSLQQGVEMGYLAYCDGRYNIIGAIARMQLCPAMRNSLTKEMKSIFFHKSNEHSQNRPSSSSSDDSREGDQNTAILSMLANIQSMIAQQNQCNQLGAKKSNLNVYFKKCPVKPKTNICGNDKHSNSSSSSSLNSNVSLDVPSAGICNYSKSLKRPSVNSRLSVKRQKSSCNSAPRRESPRRCSVGRGRGRSRGGLRRSKRRASSKNCKI